MNHALPSESYIARLDYLATEKYAAALRTAMSSASWKT